MNPQSMSDAVHLLAVLSTLVFAFLALVCAIFSLGAWKLGLLLVTLVLVGFAVAAGGFAAAGETGYSKKKLFRLPFQDEAWWGCVGMLLAVLFVGAWLCCELHGTVPEIFVLPPRPR